MAAHGWLHIAAHGWLHMAAHGWLHIAAHGWLHMAAHGWLHMAAHGWLHMAAHPWLRFPDHGGSISVTSYTHGLRRGNDHSTTRDAYAMRLPGPKLLDERPNNRHG